jgi:hypothetical protein
MLRGKLLKKSRKTIRKTKPIGNERRYYIKNIFEKRGTELEGLEGFNRVKRIPVYGLS